MEEPKYHLGGDFFRNSDGTYCYGAQTYVKRMCENYEMMFGELVKEHHAPMEKHDQPELDVTPELGPDGIKKFQSLIGAVQWTISLSRFNVAHACMSLGRFGSNPLARTLGSFEASYWLHEKAAKLRYLVPY